MDLEFIENSNNLDQQATPKKIRGYFNGFSVEITDIYAQKMLLLSHYGKGSLSRSIPQKFFKPFPKFARNRQYKQKEQWNNAANEDLMRTGRMQDLVIVLPDSDSENESMDEYFENIEPKICVQTVIDVEKLVLTLQEAFYLVHETGCLVVSNSKEDLSPINLFDLFKRIENDFVNKYIVYRHFRSCGWVVKPGIKFGGDFLLYRTGPNTCHADHVVIIRDGKKQDISLTCFLGLIRMAGTSAKNVMIADLDYSCDFSVIEAAPENLKYCNLKTVICKRIPLC